MDKIKLLRTPCDGLLGKQEIRIMGISAVEGKEMQLKLQFKIKGESESKIRYIPDFEQVGFKVKWKGKVLLNSLVRIIDRYSACGTWEKDEQDRDIFGVDYTIEFVD